MVTGMEDHAANSDDDDEDDDGGVAASASGPPLATSRSNRKRRIDILINGNLLPSNITIYQAISQFHTSTPLERSVSDTHGSASRMVQRHSSFAGAQLGNGKVFSVTYRAATHSAPGRSVSSASSHSASFSNTTTEEQGSEGGVSVKEHPIEKLIVPPEQTFMAPGDLIYPAL